jgi:KUP system potassium uptake protein
MARALSESSVSNSGAHTGRSTRRDFWALTFGSIGVVYGDIGTSPLYALRESVLATGGLSEAINAEIILGILSLIIWALILVVTVKYVLLLLRADNDGEGGTLALMALAQRALGGHSFIVLSLGIIAAALFYGDAHASGLGVIGS